MIFNTLTNLGYTEKSDNDKTIWYRQCEHGYPVNDFVLPMNGGFYAEKCGQGRVFDGFEHVHNFMMGKKYNNVQYHFDKDGFNCEKRVFSNDASFRGICESRGVVSKVNTSNIINKNNAIRNRGSKNRVVRFD